MTPWVVSLSTPNKNVGNQQTINTFRRVDLTQLTMVLFLKASYNYLQGNIEQRV
jgi:hypothetical protein